MSLLSVSSLLLIQLKIMKTRLEGHNNHINLDFLHGMASTFCQNRMKGFCQIK